jgi:hypothetical protein
MSVFQVLKHLQPERPECREKLDKILNQIHWPHFPGVHALLLKGCTNPATAEATWALLSKLTSCINAPVIDVTNSDGMLRLKNVSNFRDIIARFPNECDCTPSLFGRTL